MHKYNTQIIERLQEKYELSKRFITMSLNGDRNSETSEKIKKDYRMMEFALKKILNSM